MIVNRVPKTFSFDFDWPIDADENLQHKIEFNIKSNGSLAQNKTKMRQNNYCPNKGWKKYS